MDKHKLHLHSMMVHVIAALAPLAAIAYLFFKYKVEFLNFDTDTWSFLVYFSLVVILLTAIPSVLTGVFERNHIYANWLTTHKKKLVLSLLLILSLIIELICLFQYSMEGAILSLFGVLTIIVNNVIVFMLGVYGLKITLGRQSFGKASYTPDLFKKEPVDILVIAGKQRKVKAKYIDLLTER